MTDSYDRSQQLLAELREHDTERIAVAGRTIALLHGKRTARATVLFHGLSTSPMQFAAIALTLYQGGQNVLVPRLPKHGHADRMSDALARMTAADLRATAMQSLDIARGLGERVTVAGLSLGGLLAAWLAQNESFERAVPIAPYMGLALLPNRLAPRVMRWAQALPNFFAWWNPIMRKRQPPAHGYPRFATHSLAQAYEISLELATSAASRPPAAQRIVVVTNLHEAAVNNRAIRKLVASWKSQRSSGIETFEFSDLPISHDIVEPRGDPRIIARVYPTLLKILEDA